MKGSVLTEDRKKARRDGRRREAGDLNSKQGNQVEEGERREEESVHDLEALAEVAFFFVTGAQCSLFMPQHTHIFNPNDKCR